MKIKNVVVIGSGTMGSGIAAHLCNANVPVTLLDLKTEISEKARDRIYKSRPPLLIDKTKINIFGLVDNMSFFTGDDGKKYKIFGEGGVKKTAEEFKKKFLGEIPISPEVGKNGDEGKPIVEANPEHEISKIYLDFANKIKSTYL